ncbi:MAG: glycosyltransferase family 4 protein, partial [Nanoarchaeota archaeon]|nr:glycosyltransferase family 4 protein [Nanoarchaeota archaeon]
KLRIAHVCPFYEPAIGGVKQVVKELALRQVRDGHEVHIFTSDWDKYNRLKVKEEKIDGVWVHRCVHWFKVANFGSFWPGVFLKILCWNKKFDVVHTHVFGHTHLFFANVAGKIRRSKLVHTTHCPWSDAKRSLIGKILMPVAYNVVNRIGLMLTDKVIAITPWENQFIEKYGGSFLGKALGKRGHKALSGKIVNIPNGMSDVFFERVRRNRFRQMWGIPEDAKIVLFFGRLNPTKNPDVLVEIGKEIVRERKDVWFVFRGPDEGMKEKIRGMIKNEKQMILLDETRDRKEIAEMYQASDVYALPSYREGLPLTLFEAMASGLPVVASPVNGIPYEMEDEVNGFLVDWRDKQKWKEKILKVLDDRKLAEMFKRNNLKKARGYDWDKIAERVMGVYRE